MNAKHTLGAVRIAEIITGGSYANTETRYTTSYGRKTVREIADIIDRETAVPELLAALREISLRAGSEEDNQGVTHGRAFITIGNLARAAIAKATPPA